MEYILNVARNGRFYCRIELPNMLESEVTERARAIAARFPAEEGFKCGLMRWEKSGRAMEINSPDTFQPE